MGFFDMMEAALDKLEENDQEAAESVARRIAKENEEWCDAQIKEIFKLGEELAPTMSVTRMAGEEAMKKRLRKFAEDCFARGIRTASRLNLVGGGE